MGRGGVLPASIVREWVRPLHVWGDNAHQSAHHGRFPPSQISTPMPKVIHSLFFTCFASFLPLTLFVTSRSDRRRLAGPQPRLQLSVGIIVLTTGSYADAWAIVNEIGRRFLPVLDKMHTEQVAKQYAGKWTYGDDNIAEVAIINGAR
ncbi:hypothetical protein D9619_002968 [Psilocybe cf. subviscida]|uniref:Uncharacterized protein n=1 Tax=Psilocybe cf. subviscida TaxID=2480587 RepID=A0A8H5ETV7_9AGAR|nr:hypothetical protein D9619_002968 [Psilocybe cf. subviscida]